ncbi:MAG: hypothetical protein GY859_20420 [Desulfobacterales bacterium]|nr:hypothetical protein [Desulfobacterales bacterium]
MASFNTCCLNIFDTDQRNPCNPRIVDEGPGVDLAFFKIQGDQLDLVWLVLGQLVGRESQAAGGYDVGQAVLFPEKGVRLVRVLVAVEKKGNLAVPGDHLQSFTT